MILGTVIIIIGGVILLKNLGFISLPTSLWSFSYPLVLIAIGVYLIVAARKGKQYAGWFAKKFSKDEPKPPR